MPEEQEENSLFKNEKLKSNWDSRDWRKTVYISSRISKWIESLIGNNSSSNMVYQSKFGEHNSNVNMRLSVDGSPDIPTSKRMNASQGKPSFIENTEFGVKRREYGSFILNNNQKRKSTAICNHNTSVNDALLNPKNYNSSLGVSFYILLVLVFYITIN